VLALAFGPLLACGSGTEETSGQSSYEQRRAIAACGLDDGTVEHDAHLHACDPSETKKTTVCHVPPGNPANAHTICIGNPAVEHHLKNHHGDSIGACKVETPCPPPPPETPPPAGGMSGAGGAPEAPPPPPPATGGTSGGAGGAAGGFVIPPPG
jgi:hypothetical protein